MQTPKTVMPCSLTSIAMEPKITENTVYRKEGQPLFPVDLQLQWKIKSWQENLNIASGQRQIQEFLTKGDWLIHVPFNAMNICWGEGHAPHNDFSILTLKTLFPAFLTLEICLWRLDRRIGSFPFINQKIKYHIAVIKMHIIFSLLDNHSVGGSDTTS